jgi:hypothetical protein
MMALCKAWLADMEKLSSRMRCPFSPLDLLAVFIFVVGFGAIRSSIPPQNNLRIYAGLPVRSYFPISVTLCLLHPGSLDAAVSSFFGDFAHASLLSQGRSI